MMVRGVSSSLERAEVWSASAGVVAEVLARAERKRRVEERDVPRDAWGRVSLLLRRTAGAGAPGASPHTRAAFACVRETLIRVVGSPSLPDDEVAQRAEAFARTLDILVQTRADGAPEDPEGGRYRPLTPAECDDIRALHRFLEQLARDGAMAASAPRYPTVYGRGSGPARGGFRGAD